MSIFSERLKTTRAPKMTQVQMAAALGVSTRNYQRYESGDNEPNIETLIKIADILGCSIDYLVGRTDAPERNP